MEIARLEVSTQHHLDRMQETAKVNYVQYGKSTKVKKGKKPQSDAVVSGQQCRGRWPQGLQTQWKRQKVSISSGHLLQMVGKADTKRHRTAKLWMQHAEDVERKDTMKRFASRGNAPHTL